MSSPRLSSFATLSEKERGDIQRAGRRSALGQNGFAPRQLLALWIYASHIGLHHGTKLARALQTDAALRLLSGGHRISHSVLNRFRARSAGLSQAALEQTVKWAYEEGLVDTQALAVDSLRLRAHASPRQVRVHKHSAQRLEQLCEVDVGALLEAPAASHPQQPS